MMLDLDHFKDVNDRYGHSNGDVALLRFVDVIKKSIRGTDVPYRYGGEEFAVILYGTSGEEAVIVAERIRQQQEKNVFAFWRRKSRCHGEYRRRAVQKRRVAEGPHRPRGQGRVRGEKDRPQPCGV